MKRTITLTITQRASYGYQITLTRGTDAPIPLTGWVANPKEILLFLAAYQTADTEATLVVKTDQSFNSHLDIYYRMGRSAGEFQEKQENATA